MTTDYVDDLELSTRPNEDESVVELWIKNGAGPNAFVLVPRSKLSAAIKAARKTYYVINGQGMRCTPCMLRDMVVSLVGKIESYKVAAQQLAYFQYSMS